jgi:hypothetical protein
MPFKISSQHVPIAEVPVLLTVDVKALSSKPGTSDNRLQQLGDIFSYDPSLEQSIVKQYENVRAQPKTSGKSLSSTPPLPERHSKNTSSATTGRSPAVGREDERIRIINEKLSSLALGRGGQRSPESPAPAASSRSTHSNCTGAEAARKYLAEDTLERKDNFAAIWDATRSVSSTGPPSDEDVLRAYFTFDGDRESAIRHLTALLYLKELGFPADDIHNALLLSNGNREDALEQLLHTK